MRDLPIARARRWESEGERWERGGGEGERGRAYLRTASAGYHADVDLGLAKDGRWRSEDDIAHERKLASSSELFTHQHTTRMGRARQWRTANPLTAAMMGLRMVVSMLQLSRNLFLYTSVSVIRIRKMKHADQPN